MNRINVYELIKELLSIQDVLRWVACRFSVENIWYGHGADNPWDEALQLVLPSIHLPINTPKEIYSSRLTLREKCCIAGRVIRRVNERIPSAYLTNKAWFCGHEFYVDERVLIPRSPIGELINNRFSGLIKENPLHILDMCTGSGCIAIACAYAFPEAKIDAVDVSVEALEVTEHNIEEHCLSQRVTPILSNLFQNLPKKQYNLIIANPPYVRAEDIFNLPDEYQYEPKLGLVSGDDGLDLTNRIISCVSDFLDKNGILICEVGNNMTCLTEKHPNLPFVWLRFVNGGNGVFMLTKAQLNA